MPALDRALALAEREHAARGVREHLHLDVARRVDHLLDVERGVAERCLRLGRGGAESVLELVQRLDEPHALAAAACRGLEEHGQAEVVRRCARLLDRRRSLGPRNERHAGLAQLALRLRLVAHARHDVRRRADEDELVLVACAHEGGVLGEKAPAGMHRFAAGRRRRGDQRRDPEVALHRRRRADAQRPVGHADERRVLVGRRVDGDRLAAELVQRTDHAHRDLAAVRDEDP